MMDMKNVFTFGQEEQRLLYIYAPGNKNMDVREKSLTDVSEPKYDIRFCKGGRTIEQMFNRVDYTTTG